VCGHRGPGTVSAVSPAATMNSQNEVKTMKRHILIAVIALCLVSLVQPVFGAVDDNSSLGVSKPVQEQRAPVQTSDAKPSDEAIGKFPLDIQAKGSDQSGTLLSYKLKEEVIASRLFELTASEKKKFVLHIASQPEFPDRPGIASIYSIVLVFQEDAGSLTYFLNHYQGQVHPEGVPAEMRRILEWTYSNMKRFHYLLDE
jgi:hypothetical protein